MRGRIRREGTRSGNDEMQRQAIGRESLEGAWTHLAAPTSDATTAASLLWGAVETRGGSLARSLILPASRAATAADPRRVPPAECSRAVRSGTTTSTRCIRARAHTRTHAHTHTHTAPTAPTQPPPVFCAAAACGRRRNRRLLHRFEPRNRRRRHRDPLQNTRYGRGNVIGLVRL